MPVGTANDQDSGAHCGTLYFSGSTSRRLGCSSRIVNAPVFIEGSQSHRQGTTTAVVGIGGYRLHFPEYAG